MRSLFVFLSILSVTMSSFADKVIIPELIGNFDKGLDAWEIETKNGHTIGIDNSAVFSTGQCAILSVENDLILSSDLQLKYIFSAFKGAKYKLQFKVKANREALLKVDLWNQNLPINSVLSKEVAVSANTQTCTWISENVTSSSGNYSLTFSVDSATKGTQIWIDEVRLLDTTTSTTDNLIVNGNFEESVQLYYNNALGIVQEMADPFILKHNNKYYLYGTDDIVAEANKGFKVYVSDDMINWSAPQGVNDGRALIDSDSWGTGVFMGAEVYERNEVFYMFYTVNEHIAIATSDSPLGPFKQKNKQPLRDVSEIDPHLFVDEDGKAYIYYVSFQNNANEIYVEEMNDDWLTTKPETKKRCIWWTQIWENSDPQYMSWPITEGTATLKHKGIYYLFYTGNHFLSPKYAVGYATSNSPFGPWRKYEGNPILSQTNILKGTGHCSFVCSPNDDLYIVYHSHKDVINVCPRKMAFDKCEFVPNNDPSKPDIFKVDGPTDTYQVVPWVGNHVYGAPAPGWQSQFTVFGSFGVTNNHPLEGVNSMQIVRQKGNATSPDQAEQSVVFYAHPDEEYAISFDISADIPFYGDIHTGPISLKNGEMPIGGYLNAVDKLTSGGLATLGLKHWETTTSKVTTNNKGYYKFVMQFGWIDIPTEGNVKFLIDNIKVQRVSPLPEEYSDMVSGLVEKKRFKNSLYVDSERQINIKLATIDECILTLYNINGVALFITTIRNSGKLKVPNSIPSGAYILKLSSKLDGIIVSKAIIR